MWKSGEGSTPVNCGSGNKIRSAIMSCIGDVVHSPIEPRGADNVDSPVEMRGGDNSCSPVELLGGDNSCSPVELRGGDNSCRGVELRGGDNSCSPVELRGENNSCSPVERCTMDTLVGPVRCIKSQKKGTAKKIRTAPTNTSLLPPCKVCLAPAAGFHYGANTCEACKGFFRRSTLRTQAYRCQGQGNCNIGVGKRKICPRCRYAKCLSVGMSKEAIKTGRYTHAKRTQDIIEYQQIFQQKSASAEMLPSSYHTSAFAHRIQMNRGEMSDNQFNSSHTNRTQLSSDQSGPAATHCMDTTGTSLSAVEPCRPDSSELPSPFNMPFTLSPVTNGPNVNELFGRVDEADPRSPVVPLLSPTSCSTIWSDSLHRSGSSTECDRMTDMECEGVVSQLVRAHRKYLVSATDKLTTQQLLDKQLVCYEACQVKVQMFGHRGLSDDEYHEVFRVTGLDVDNRQSLQGSILTLVDRTVQQYIAFAKHIPGFSDLKVIDQIRLIKDNRCEFRMFSTFHLYNQQLQVMTLLSGRTECVHELSKVVDRKHLCQRFQCAEVIRKLCLSEEELIVLKSWMVVCVGDQDVEDADKVSSIQWRITQCLRWLLHRNRSDADRTLARIMTAVCHIRELCHGFYIWLQSKPFNHPLMDSNTLLSEWFSVS